MVKKAIVSNKSKTVSPRKPNLKIEGKKIDKVAMPRLALNHNQIQL